MQRADDDQVVVVIVQQLANLRYPPPVSLCDERLVQFRVPGDTFEQPAFQGGDIAVAPGANHLIDRFRNFSAVLQRLQQHIALRLQR